MSGERPGLSFWAKSKIAYERVVIACVEPVETACRNARNQAARTTRSRQTGMSAPPLAAVSSH